MATPDFQWLRLRIAEEKERREREAMVLERLPRAAADLQQSLATCVERFNAAFGHGCVELECHTARMRIIVRDIPGVLGHELARVEILNVAAIPGFEIDRAGRPLVIEIGMLPGDKLFYRDREADQYLTMEELTRRILDRALFPKLRE